MLKHIPQLFLVKDMDQYCWIMLTVMEMRLLFLTVNMSTPLSVTTALMQELTVQVAKVYITSHN